MERQNPIPAAAPVPRPDVPGGLPAADLRDLVEGLDAIVWERDAASGRFTYVSPQAERIVGYPPERWYEDPHFWTERLVHPADRTRMEKAVERARRTGEGFEFEERIVRPDGSERLLLSRGRAVRDAAGQVARLMGTSRDVTEQRKAVVHDLALAREQAARVQAEEEQERTRFLSEAGRTLSSSLDYATTLHNFAHLAVPRIADWCAIDVVEEDGKVRRVVTAHPDPAKEAMAVELEQRYPSDPDAPTGVPQVLRTGEPELVPDSRRTSWRPPRWTRSTSASSASCGSAPTWCSRSSRAAGRLGAITFVSAESGRRYDEDDLALRAGAGRPRRARGGQRGALPRRRGGARAEHPHPRQHHRRLLRARQRVALHAT